MGIPNTQFVQKAMGPAVTNRIVCMNTEFVHYVDQKETADNVQLHSGTLLSSQSITKQKLTVVPKLPAISNVALYHSHQSAFLLTKQQVIDPSRLVDQKLSVQEKEHIIKLGPCQPS